MIESDYIRKFSIDCNLQNSYSSHERLCELANFLQVPSLWTIEIDFTNVNFIASNLFAVLGCLLGEYLARNPDKKKIGILGIRDSISEIIRKNGFYVHFNNMTKLPDIHNTTIPYKIFKVFEIDEYERYLTLSLFARKDLPQMSKAVSDNIRDSLLELFKNVSDHTNSTAIYTCGQYFPKSEVLYFTIVDAGTTIYGNVKRFHELRKLEVPKCCLEWAIGEGNTTLETKTPRGIGLSLIRDFVKLNKGEIYIVSGMETYEMAKAKERYKSFKESFPGTIVTIGFNLKDKSSYHMKSEENTTIQF